MLKLLTYLEFGWDTGDNDVTSVIGVYDNEKDLEAALDELFDRRGMLSRSQRKSDLKQQPECKRMMGRDIKELHGRFSIIDLEMNKTFVHGY